MVVLRFRAATAALLTSAGLFAVGSPSNAQIVASESATVTQTISGTTFELLFSRPSLRGRQQIFGGIHPIGETWTGGANSATELRISKDVVMGGIQVPAGAYSVWIDVVEGNDWRMMLHEDTSMFHVPHPPMDAEQVIFPVAREQGQETVQSLEWRFEDLSWNGATLALAWGTERLRVEVEVDPGITLAVASEEAARYVGEWTIDDSTGRMPAERIEEMLSDPDAGVPARRYAEAMRDIPTERVVSIVQDPETGWLFRTDAPFVELWSSLMLTDPSDERFEILIPRGEGFFHVTQGLEGQLRSYFPDYVSVAEFFYDDTGRAISFEVRDSEDEIVMTGVRVGS